MTEPYLRGLQLMKGSQLGGKNDWTLFEGLGKGRWGGRGSVLLFKGSQ